ncbi:hypothetical protein [Streptococcus suis]|uniref:hypothetical protein n=1 Tax=Streptococcus suis TaxID=1307 RepID=UPI0006B41CA0|nr:hypothetical protein A7J10_05470 [Streptococcus suis]KPA64049.1 hypothetical protein XK27_10690 [Streptococcus suis]
MSRKLMRVVLGEVAGKKQVFKSLHTTNDDLAALLELLEFPKNTKLKEQENLGIFDTPNRFQISDLKNENPYYELVKLFDIDYLKKENKLQSIDEITDTTFGFSPNVALYYCKEDAEQTIYLVPIQSKKLLVKNKFFLLPKLANRLGYNRSIELEFKSIDKGLDLPREGFIGKLSKSRSKKYSLEVYDVVKLDFTFSLESHIVSYAKNKLHRFNTPDSTGYKITKDKLNVEITDISATIDIVEKNLRLSKALSQYTGHGNRAINRVSKESLQNAIERLLAHVDDEEIVYTAKDIPTISLDGKLIVSPQQIKIFTALLDNKIVEKILTNDIELPYFD